MDPKPTTIDVICALPSPPCPAPPALPCPALPCPALPCPGLAWPGLALACPPLPCVSTSSSPDKARGSRLFVGIRRAAGTGREDPQPDTNPSQLCFAVFGRLYIELRKEAESKKAPLEGGLGGEP